MVNRTLAVHWFDPDGLITGHPIVTGLVADAVFLVEAGRFLIARAIDPLGVVDGALLPGVVLISGDHLFP